MKYILSLDWRVTENVSMEMKHQSIIEMFKRMQGVLSMDENLDYPPPKFGNDAMAIYSLAKKFSKGISGDIMYAYRAKLEDHHLRDDRLWIEFNSKKVDFSYFFDYAVKELLHKSSPYILQVYDKELVYSINRLIPFEKREKLNARFDLKFFYPFQYIDGVLTRRIFGFDARTLFEKLTNRIYKVELINDGIFIQGFDHFPDEQESCLFNELMQDILHVVVPIYGKD